MYPLISSLPKAPSSLCPQLQTILLAAGHVAAGDAGGTVSAFRHIDKGNIAKAYELAILQAAPIVGIPRVLHSAAALQSFGVVGSESESESSSLLHTHSLRQLREKGEDTFATVYARNETRVRQRIKAFHPDLDHWIQTCVYGWILSNDRHGISLRERELCLLAMLCVDMSAGVQIASHIRGAVNAGAKLDEVEAVIKQTEVICEPAFANAHAVWESYHRARYAL